MIQALKALWNNRKAMEIPGWVYVIALIIGLFVLLFAIWLTAKAGQKQAGWMEWIR
jgi:hypothetical protein